MTTRAARDLYWAYNVPLQAWVSEEEDEEGNEAGTVVVLNYAPRKERCAEMPLSDAYGGVTRAEYFEHAAACLENLARLMREFGQGKRDIVRYHDEDMAVLEVHP